MVDIRIIANPHLSGESRELEAAKSLMEIFSKSLQQNEQGRVLILPSLKLYGSRCKDIDFTVFASFDPPIRRRVKCRTRGKELDDMLRDRELDIQSFCTIIEVKSHDETCIRWIGSQAEVRYDGEWHNVSDQSDAENVALRTFFEDTIEWKPSPYTANLIWFTELPREGLREHRQNFLPGAFSFLELLTLICRQAMPLKMGRSDNARCLLKCTKTEGDDAEVLLYKAMKHFTEVRRSVGQLTRDKLESITKHRILRDQAYVQSLGTKLVLVRGRAGTGKTMKILHLAQELAEDKRKRCLILTYNLALVSDIRRLIALAKLSSDLPTGRLEVCSIHSMMLDLMDGLGVDMPNDGGLGFHEVYERRRHRFHSYLTAGVLTDSDVTHTLGTKSRLCWDFLFIDEGQDWPEEERDILYRLYGSNRFVVADGMDQLVRTQVHTDWTDGVEYHQPVISEKISLRQKGNLIRFQSTLAERLGLPKWDLPPPRFLAANDLLMSRV